MKDVPQFEPYQEELEWRFVKIAESIKSLAIKVKTTEGFLSKGANMIQYKIPGHDSYSDLRGVFDDLYERLNKIEEDIAINGSLSDRDRSELSEPD